MPPRSRSELKEVGIARPRRDKLLWTSVLLQDYLFIRFSYDSHRPVFDRKEQPPYIDFNFK